MEYLLLSVLVIVVYAEVLPTISIIFELIRTWITSKITIIQQHTVHMQEDIQNVQTRLEQTNSTIIGFHTSNEEEMEENEYE